MHTSDVAGRPRVFINTAEFGRLLPLADAARTQGAALLREELARARIIHAETRPGFAHLGSVVTFLDRDSGEVRTVELVLPDQEDGAADRISILSPLGAALIGLGEGAEFWWKPPSGDGLQIRVLGVGRREGNTDVPIRYYRRPPFYA
jgi:regulator of nucleoside diphosphate kinase